MTDPVALLSEHVRIDTSNPPGDCRGAAELLCGALQAEGLSPVMFGALHGRTYPGGGDREDD